ncbi:FliH/SctL family protein [Neobacillus sp. 114]|uniref:FliH/SctL family protein n=1 Tax=Neobacillus sp. 114 TaxID=3048535 RepID=UPI0024C346C1|nr:FliH/SctL family protein [Neobacillus sp. 114]
MSRLVKAYKVVSKSETKIVSLPNPIELPDEEEIPFHEEEPLEFNQMKKELEEELSNRREQALKEIADWRRKEEEQFRLELEQEKRRGYQEGYEIGIEEGRNHGLGQYTQLVQKANAVLEQAYQEKIAIIREAEPFVVNLSIEIASKILQQELKTNQETLLPMIKESITSVYETSSLTINVSPEDYSFVQKQREQLFAVVNGKVEVKILPDYSIQHGGCIIHTSSGSVDARIDTQLSEIKKALLAYQQEDRHE